MSLSNRITVIGGFFVVAALAINGQMNPKPQPYNTDNRPAPPPVQQVDIPEVIDNGCAQIYTSFEGIYAQNDCAFPIRVAYCQASASVGCKANNYLFPGQTIYPGKYSKLNFKMHPGNIRLHLVACAAPRRPQMERNGEYARFSCVLK